jgi:hypothetical protein
LFKYLPDYEGIPEVMHGKDWPQYRRWRWLYALFAPFQEGELN